MTDLTAKITVQSHGALYLQLFHYSLINLRGEWGGGFTTEDRTMQPRLFTLSYQLEDPVTYLPPVQTAQIYQCSRPWFNNTVSHEYIE